MKPILFAVAIAVLLAGASPASGVVRVPETARNLLVDAKVSGNLESFNKGLRGELRDMIFDHQQGAFVRSSQWNEYGVGYNEDLGVVPEARPAWWMAEWAQPVKANLILLTGTHHNQPQPKTAWKIELRRDGRWTTHARGIGGWYDRGQYAWGGPETEPLTFNALRVSVFSPDDKTPIRSIHFRGEAHRSWVVALSPVAARITPLAESVMAGRPVAFDAGGSVGKIAEYRWDFGDGAQAKGARREHTFSNPGLYKVTLTVTDGAYEHHCMALVRVHTEGTVHLPQVLLDTDARNEIDDQHYIAYALFSNLDVLGINSIHHGGGQEPINYAEIQRIIELSRQSGLPEHRVPPVFRGADRRLSVPASGNWSDTQPVKSEASEAILAAARGASPDNPVWVLPVGPCSNIASAILQVRQEGWEAEFHKRIRVCWLGGGPTGAAQYFNGGNCQWSPWVTYKSGIKFVMFLERPTGFSIKFNPKTDLYPSNPLGDYLKTMTADYLKRRFNDVMYLNKAMYDIGVISLVIGEHLGRPWLTRVEPSILLPDREQGHRHQPTAEPTNLYIVHEIDHEAMKKDFFDTLNGKPTFLPPMRQKR